MGKTWTLTEVARRLLEEGSYLVGYHESTGGESSHLLYAVSSLYTRWLVDSTLRDQAISLWERHKEGLVPRIGKMVGMLLEKLGTSVAPAEVSGTVRAVFDGLAEAQEDLLGGGLPVGDRVEPLHLDGDLAIGDRLHLERVQTAEIGDLVEGQGGVLDQPHGGRFRHQGSGHGKFLV